jgi:hypothetical protein
MSLTLRSSKGGKPHGEQDFQAQLANHIARFDHLHGYQWPDLKQSLWRPDGLFSALRIPATEGWHGYP